ncbi:DNA packaging protein [Elephant endotheliotropic herpesvirus 3A]|uniref:Packaging protein UL32 n=1 Tax=Elephant endotheliotropic herpesvirus 3A TaxID=1329409 RepID=A0A866VSK1_9BETA|nr:DNA packaging protein [Elephant endotheliotropic herpesvirus 3A]QOE74425.1 DNA packaging protein [Elephant endotheliotropic herpesvirus 3A]
MMEGGGSPSEAPRCSDFTGFNSATIRLDDPILNTILSCSHLEVEDTDTEQPALVFEAAGFQISTAVKISKTVTIDRPCPICTLVHRCVSAPDHVEWLLDYCTLCYKSCYAPRSGLSNLILGVDLFRLIESRLGPVTEDLFTSGQVTPLDVYIHFHVNRCFARLHNACANENTTIAHLQVLRCILTEAKDVPFRKNSIHFPSKHEPKRNKQHPMTVDRESTFLPVLIYMWGQTSVLQLFDDIPAEYCRIISDRDRILWSSPSSSPPLPSPGHTSDDASSSSYASYPSSQEEDEEDRALLLREAAVYGATGSGDTSKNRAVGPILLAPHPTLAHKNNTTSVCLLCELSATSYDNCRLLDELKNMVDTYCENNLKLVDKILFVLDDLERQQQQRSPSDGGDTSPRIDPCVMALLKHVGPIGLYKHFYCDLMCACNTRTVNPDILFGVPSGDLYETKLEICHANEYFTLYNKEHWLVVQYYKAFQTAEDTFKRKTQIRDFIRETKAVLAQISIDLIDVSFTIDQYV